MKSLFFIGLILILIGFLLTLFSSFQPSKTQIKTAGGIFLGPFPILSFANDKKLLYLLFGIAMIIFITFKALIRT